MSHLMLALFNLLILKGKAFAINNKRMVKYKFLLKFDPHDIRYPI